jgi:hypothetical protein
VQPLRADEASVIVFRDSHEVVDGCSAIERLRLELSDAGAAEPRALFAAAEVECAFADLDHAQAEQAASITDAAAAAWLQREQGPAEATRSLVEALQPPAQLERRIPEGFAYYALAPKSYAELARAHAGRDRRALVVGIRSIGVSLSAVVAAELRRLGSDVVRFSVRPTGHPWARQLSLTPREVAHVARHPGADVLVVDEGPGLSGSTFLAVGEALIAAGVAADRITFLCSHEFDPAQLRAEGAAARYARFAIRAVPAWQPPTRTRSLAGGSWRSLRCPNAARYPACWSNLERVKYRTEDKRTLVKFEGFGAYADASWRRAVVLAEGHWSPRVRRSEPGYFGYEWVDGRLPEASDRGWLLPRLAEYLTFRSRALSHSGATVAPLEQMLRVNAAEAFGVELPGSVHLDVARPIEPDARLAPHEWVIGADAELRKTDSADHANDHLMPGAADVAWDLAGVIVEWELDRAERRWFLQQYRTRSGDDAAARLPAYLAAYSAFRLGFAGMARDASPRAERARWVSRERVYRRCLRRALSELNVDVRMR